MVIVENKAAFGMPKFLLENDIKNILTSLNYYLGTEEKHEL